MFGFSSRKIGRYEVPVLYIPNWLPRWMMFILWPYNAPVGLRHRLSPQGIARYAELGETRARHIEKHSS